MVVAAGACAYSVVIEPLKYTGGISTNFQSDLIRASALLDILANEPLAREPMRFATGYLPQRFMIGVAEIRSAFRGVSLQRLGAVSACDRDSHVAMNFGSLIAFLASYAFGERGDPATLRRGAAAVNDTISAKQPMRLPKFIAT